MHYKVNDQWIYIAVTGIYWWNCTISVYVMASGGASYSDADDEIVAATFWFKISCVRTRERARKMFYISSISVFMYSSHSYFAILIAVAIFGSYLYELLICFQTYKIIF